MSFTHVSFLDQSLGQIATTAAGATAVFHQYKLNFCCGGQHSLREALAEKELDATPTLNALRQLQQQDGEITDWRSIWLTCIRSWKATW